MATENKYYKWCFVPSCSNTSINNHNKLFISVPKEYSRKLKWFKAAKRDMPKSQSGFFCCEDHFDLKEDMENYMRFKLMGGNIILKRDVVPHIFECQKDKKRTISTTEESTFIKQQKKCIVEQAILESTLLPPNQADVASASKVNEQEIVTSLIESVKCEPVMRYNESVVFKHSNHIAGSNLPSANVKYKSIGIQVRPHFRSKYTLCDIKNKIAHSPIETTSCRNQSTTALEQFPSSAKVSYTTTDDVLCLPESDREFDDT